MAPRRSLLIGGVVVLAVVGTLVGRRATTDASQPAPLAAGVASSTDATETSPPATAADGAPPVIAAAGDIACNGPAPGTTRCQEAGTAALIAAGPEVAAVLPLGDLQYECGDYPNLLRFYDATWGRFRAVTHPAIGNHEYLTTRGGSGCDPSTTVPAKGYFDYWNGVGTASGPAGDRTRGYYSYEVGSWHLIALNSNCARVGGCDASSPQGVWLRNDLAAHPGGCTLAYWHHPRFSSG